MSFYFISQMPKKKERKMNRPLNCTYGLTEFVVSTNPILQIMLCERHLPQKHKLNSSN